MVLGVFFLSLMGTHDQRMIVSERTEMGPLLQEWRKGRGIRHWIIY